MSILSRVISFHNFSDELDAHTGNHDFTENNTPTYGTDGTIGDYVRLDASDNSYLSIANANAGDYDFSNTFAISLFVYPEALPTSGTSFNIFRKGANSATDEGFAIVYHNNAGTGQIRFRVSDGTTLFNITSSGHAVNNWYHVFAVCCKEGGWMRLVVNGVNASTTLTAGPTNWPITSNDDVLVGGTSDEDGDVRVSKLLVYSGALSDHLRTKLNNSGASLDYQGFLDVPGPYVEQEFFGHNTSAVSSITVSVGGQESGQKALAFLFTDDNATDYAVANWTDAWTSVGSGSNIIDMAVWTRTVSEANESETSVVLSWLTTTEPATGVVQFWSDCAGVNASDVSSQGTASSSGTAQSITTDVDGCEIVFGLCTNGTATTSVPGGTLLLRTIGVGSDLRYIMGLDSQATAGATGTYAFTLSGSTRTMRYTIAMEPMNAEEILLGYTDSAGASYALGSIEAPASLSLGFTDSASVSYALGSLESAASILLGFTDSSSVSYSLALQEAASEIVLGFTDSVSASYSFGISETILLGFTSSASVSYAIKRIGPPLSVLSPLVVPSAGNGLVVPSSGNAIVVPASQNLFTTS